MNLNSSQNKRDSVSNRRVSIGYAYSEKLPSPEVGNSNLNNRTCDSCESSTVSKELKSLQQTSCEALKVCSDEVTSLKLILQQEIASIEILEKELQRTQKNEERILKRITNLEKKRLASECEQDDGVADDYIHSARRVSVGGDTDGSGDKEGDELLDLQLTTRDLAIKAMEETLAENYKRIHDLLEAQQDGK